MAYCGYMNREFLLPKLTLMKFYYRQLALLLCLFFSVTIAFSQNIVIRGNVKNLTGRENISSASVTVRGSGEGTLTDAQGNFSLSVKKLPVVLIVSSIGFETKEI